MNPKISVAIVDDHPLVISGIQMMLSDQDTIQVGATYNSGTALLAGLKEQLPDVLLMDILLPDISGNELAGLINKSYPEVKMVALTSLDTPAMVKSMKHNGCKSYLLKGTDKTNLVKAIEAACTGAEFIDPCLAENLLQSIINPQKSKSFTPLQLSNREQEVLELIAAGETTHAIADQLFISPRTVETHRLTLLKKLAARNTAELVSNAFRFGFVS